MALGGGDEPEMCLSAIQVTVETEDQINLLTILQYCAMFGWEASAKNGDLFEQEALFAFFFSMLVCNNINCMCTHMSLFQLALIYSPPLSEIFVFTDASPKDSHLYSTVKALLLEKQSKVRHSAPQSLT